jgi:hypothetical protein
VLALRVVMPAEPGLCYSRAASTRTLYHREPMGRLRHRTEMPCCGPTAGDLQAAHALSAHLLHTGELRRWPGPMRDLAYGEVPYAAYRVAGAAIHARDHSTFRHWRPLLQGGEVNIEATSTRLRIGSYDLRLAGLKRLEPRARDLSVLDIKAGTGDRFRLWGQHVPELTVILGWLLWRRVISVGVGEEQAAHPRRRAG